LIKTLKYHINSFEYLVKSALTEESARKPGGEREVVAAVAPYIHTIDSNVKREGCIRYLSETLRVETSAIEDDLRQIGSGNGTERKNSAWSSEIPEDSQNLPVAVTPELFLMLAVTVNRASFAYVRSMIGIDDLNDPNARDLYIALEEAFRNGEQSLETLIQRLDRQKLKELVYERISREEFTVNGEEIIRDGVKSLRTGKLIERRRKVEAEIREAEREGIPVGQLRELVGEKIYLDQELKKGKGDKE
jgi:DNA primase